MSQQLLGLNKSTQNIVYWAVFAIYTLLIFYGVANHEPWRDEALSWLMCRDMTISDLFRDLPIEGGPPLWYIVILPFVKLGLPYMIQNYIAAVLLAATIWLFLFRTSLPLYLKIILPFSFFFVYQYSVFARNYALVPFFAMSIIVLYPKRFNKPWLFAAAVIGLFNSNALAFTLAGGIAILFGLDALLEKKLKGKVLAAFFTMSIGGAYLIPYFILRAPSMNAYVERIQDHSGEIIKAISNAFFTFNEDTGIGLLVFAIIAVCLLARPKAFIALLLGMIAACYILGYKYVGAARHQGVIIVIVLTALALAYQYRDDKWNPKIKFNTTQIATIVLSLSLLFQVKVGFDSWGRDNNELFSDGKGVAEFLSNNNLDRSHVIAHRSFAAFSVFPYLQKDIRFFYPECMVYGSFLLDDSCHLTNQFLQHDYAVYVTDTMLFKPGQTLPPKPVTLLLNAPIQHPELAKDWELIYQTAEPTIMKDESFFVYRRKGMGK